MNDVESLSMQLDKAAATLIVSEEGERHFIAESALAAVTLYLLKKYADGYLKGLGFEDLAKRHGEKTLEFLRQLRAGLDAGATALARRDLDESLGIVRAQAPNDQARAVALEVVVQVYLEAGAIRLQAEREAGKVAAAADQMFKP